MAQIEKATEKINSIYDKLSIPESIKVWEQTGNHLHERITEEQDKKGKEIMDLAEIKNQLSGITTK